jgi:predicted transcriptional regulator
MSLNGWKSINRNRNKLDIVRDMLAIASTKVKKTRIMYQANLNYVQMEKYLKVLLDEGLLARDGDDGSLYLITKKGREFLRVYADYLKRRRRLVEEVDGTVKHRLLLENMCFNGKGEVNQAKIWKDALA